MQMLKQALDGVTSADRPRVFITTRTTFMRSETPKTVFYFQVAVYLPHLFISLFIDRPTCKH